MRLKSSKESQSIHQKNIDNIKGMIRKYKDEATSSEDRIRILNKFKTILDHVDGKTSGTQESLFLRMVKFSVNGKHG